MTITKMHGTGNDFILINNIKEQIPDSDLDALARSLCHRRFSVGADGLILADHSTSEDIRMIFINADGSRGEMCGNGARCFSRFCYEEGLVSESMSMETLAGKVESRRIDESFYQVTLPNPWVINDMTLEVQGRDMDATYVELGHPGVPHLCTELHNLEDIDQDELFLLGKTLRGHRDLVKGANVNFYKKLKEGTYLEKTFERGVEDFTMSCGTGSASVAITIWKKNPQLKNTPIELEVPGGRLIVEAKWDHDQVKELLLTGPTEVVFRTTL